MAHSPISMARSCSCSTCRTPSIPSHGKLGTRGSSSAATSDHLAFNHFAEEGLLAIPMTPAREAATSERRSHDVQRPLVYRVDVRAAFERLGSIDHGSHGRSTVVRRIFMDDLVYSMGIV
ncbi:beta-propeller domain-containing protein [Pendulispora brunnea]|uniref:Beta-propeller domain-containing protein n=1 Tax=Pendulispora brunnea TaxID=2905690 RepID=A0ABZ2K199_9BACT